MAALLYWIRAFSALIARVRYFCLAVQALIHSVALRVASWTAPSTELDIPDDYYFEDLEALFFYAFVLVTGCAFSLGWILGNSRAAIARGPPRGPVTTSGAAASAQRLHTPPAVRAHLPVPAPEVRPINRRQLRRVDADPASPIPRNLENEFPVMVLGSPRHAAPSAVGGWRPH